MDIHTLETSAVSSSSLSPDIDSEVVVSWSVSRSVSSSSSSGKERCGSISVAFDTLRGAPLPPALSLSSSLPPCACLSGGVGADTARERVAAVVPVPPCAIKFPRVSMCSRTPRLLRGSAKSATAHKKQGLVAANTSYIEAFHSKLSSRKINLATQTFNRRSMSPEGPKCLRKKK